MKRSVTKILVSCVLVLAVLLAAFVLERTTSKNPGLTEKAEKTQVEMAAVYGEPTIPTVAPQETQPPQITEPAQTTPVPAVQENYVLTFLGDCTFGSPPGAYYAQVGFVNTVGDNYGYPFENVRTYVEEDDFTFLNLEGPLCDEGYPTGGFCFHGPSDFINLLTENSVEGVTLANNHIMDYGKTGFDSTVKLLEEAQIPYVKSNETTLITLDGGLTIGVYGSVYTSMDREDMEADIAGLKQQGADLIIYAAHWGTDGSFEPTKEQTELAHAAIDAGANIVYGTHPHVLQPIEEYNGGVIFYSLGNFSFGGNASPKDYDTAVIQQEVVMAADGTVSLAGRTVVPCSVSSAALTNNFQPLPYEEGTREYERVMEKLSGTYASAGVR